MDATAKAQRGRKLEGEWRKIGDVEGETEFSVVREEVSKVKIATLQCKNTQF